MMRAPDKEIHIPLVVDLDGTLTVTDTLYEGFAKLLFHDPIGAVASLLQIARGPAAVKRFIAQRRRPDAAALPYRADLVELLREEKARGRPIHLVTAADQTIADAVAAELSLFDSATGSDGKHNFKGERKLAWVRSQFAHGFIYAGDDAADIPIFRAARGVILCDVTPGTESAVTAAGTPVLARLRRPSNLMHDWWRALTSREGDG